MLLDEMTSQGWADVVCGDLLGVGVSREVYESRLSPGMVVKFEHGDYTFANVSEWQLWNELKFSDAGKWLAPCHAISKCGKILIQKKTSRPRSFPKKIPAWITDEKRSNFGMIGRRFVCHDYAVNLVTLCGATARMKNADWWDG